MIKAHHTRMTGTGQLAQPSTHHHRSEQLLAGWRVCEDGDNHETMMMTRPDYRMTRAPGTATAGDSEGDENKMTMTTMMMMAITTTPPTAAASNCSWGGNGGKNAEEGEDADDGPEQQMPSTMSMRMSMTRTRPGDGGAMSLPPPHFAWGGFFLPFHF